jgi:hypothetical protein
MCRALYIASDNLLPLIEWEEKNPGFCVLEMQDSDEAVRKQFTLPFVAYAGSFEGCSCGFVYDEEPLENDQDEKRYDEQARESVRRLGEYVASLWKVGSVELFDCWEGDQEHEPDERLSVGLEFFNGKEFGFERTTHVKVVSFKA